MKTYTTLDTFKVTGRGTAHATISPAGEALPKKGELVILDGVTVRVTGVERHPLSEDRLMRSRQPISLLSEPVTDDCRRT